MRHTNGVMVVLLCGVSALAAQKTPAGTVTGHVTCSDTQLPARFAQVSLVHKPTAAEWAAFAEPEGKGKPEPPDIFTLLQERTGLDGGYTIGNVPPGDYWVVAQRDGYLYQLGLRTDDTMPLDLDKMLAGAPVVHVAANGMAKADVTLVRGATVEGQVLFDDGSAAVDWEVWLLPVGAKGVTPLESPYADAEADHGPFGRTDTDDRGRFRMAGIPPGKYLVATQLSIKPDRSDGYRGSFGQRILAFAPGVFSRGDARQVEVRGAEDVAVDLKLDFSQLHSISGRVVAKTDQEAVYGSLVTATSGSGGQTTHVSRDGSFHLDYLTPGTYTVSIIPGFPDPKDRTRHFEHPQQTVVVGDSDVTVDDFLLVEKPRVPTP